MERDVTEPETMGRVIPFRPRGSALPLEEPPPPEHEPPDRDTAGALRVILISMGIFFLFASGVAAGWLMGTAHRPSQLLNVLQHRLQPDGVILSPQAESLLVYPLRGGLVDPSRYLTSLPMRLSEQSVTPERARQLGLTATGLEDYPFSNRALELAILLAIEEERDPALLQGLARLTLAQAGDREDLLLAHKALELALGVAPQDVNILNDFAVLNLALGRRHEAERYLEEAVALLETYDPRIKPVLYNQALMKRGDPKPQVELDWLQRYLAMEGADSWSLDMAERRDVLLEEQGL